MGEEGGNDFDDFAVGLFDEAGVLFEGFDFFPFPVAFEVVFVGFTFAIVHEVHAGGAEHLHHEAGATAGEAADEGEGGGLDGVFFGLFFGFGFAFFLSFGVADFGAGGDAVAEGLEVFFALGGVDDFEADELGLVVGGLLVLTEGLMASLEDGEGAGVVGVELEAVFEGLDGVVVSLELGEGLAEDEVTAGVAELALDGLEGEVGGGVEITGVMEGGTGEGDEGLIGVGVGVEEFFGTVLGVFPLAEGDGAAAEDFEELGVVGGLLAEALEVIEGGLGLAFLELDLGLEEVGGEGVAEGLKTDVEGFGGFFGKAEVELGAGEGLGVVGAFGDGIEAVFEEGEGGLVVTGVEGGAGEVPFVFALGLEGGFGGVGGDFVDVAEVDELLEEGVGFFLGKRAAFLRGTVGVFPGGDGFGGGVFFKGFGDDAAFHVLADGEAEVVKDGGGDIEEAGAVDGV